VNIIIASICDVVRPLFRITDNWLLPCVAVGDRVFYESLYKQKPTSEMAQEWCVAYGILNEAEAVKLHTAICKRKGKPVVISPVRNDTKKTSSNNVKGRRIHDDDIEADTGLTKGSGWEGMGTMGL
jgi:hypothetical protein